MKLFDAIFQILTQKQKELVLGNDLKIFALSEGFYLNFEHNSDKTWAAEKHHPTRRQIEEHLTKIILEEEARTAEIANFLNENLTTKENPLSTNKSIREVLKKDHPEIVKNVETLSKDEELSDAAADLIAQTIKTRAINSNSSAGGGLGYFDKEYYENLKYDTKKNVFVYEEGDPLCSIPEKTLEFQSVESFKVFLKKHRYVEIKDGIVTGRGNPTRFMPYWLHDMGLGSIRDYILTQKTNSSIPQSKNAS